MNVKLCECGCGVEAPIAKSNDSKRGLVKGEPLRFIHGHNRNGGPKPMSAEERRASAEERFKKYFIVADTGCHLWTGSITPNGYGVFWGGSRNEYAHIFSWVKVNGSVPEGKELDHLCRVRRCVNEKHLEPVTRIENVRRGLNAPKTHCHKGHLMVQHAKSYYDKKRGVTNRMCMICNKERCRNYKLKIKGAV